MAALMTAASYSASVAAWDMKSSAKSSVKDPSSQPALRFERAPIQGKIRLDTRIFEVCPLSRHNEHVIPRNQLI
jgi:hypothetical protein